MNAKYVYEESVKAVKSYCDDNNADFEKTMDRIYEFKECRSVIDSQLTIFAGLIISAREEILKKKNNGNVLPAIKRIFKRCKNQTGENLRTSWIDGEGRQCFCDGIYAIRLNNKYDCFPIEKKLIPLDLDKIINPVRNEKEEIELPTIAEIKLYISDLKVKGIKEKDAHLRFRYKFNNRELYVNPQLLLDMLEALPNATARYSGSSVSPIYFNAENGDGILLPVRP